MKSRLNVRCPACHWYTSRAPASDYGDCPRCQHKLVEARTRAYFARAQAMEPGAVPLALSTQFATWPELVAAELERRERKGR